MNPNSHFNFNARGVSPFCPTPAERRAMNNVDEKWIWDSFISWFNWKYELILWCCAPPFPRKRQKQHLTIFDFRLALELEISYSESRNWIEKFSIFDNISICPLKLTAESFQCDCLWCCRIVIRLRAGDKNSSVLLAPRNVIKIRRKMIPLLKWKSSDFYIKAIIEAVEDLSTFRRFIDFILSENLRKSVEKSFLTSISCMDLTQAAQN